MASLLVAENSKKTEIKPTCFSNEVLYPGYGPKRDTYVFVLAKVFASVSLSS